MPEIKPRQTVHQQRPDKGDARRAPGEAPGLPHARDAAFKEFRKEVETKPKSVNIQATLIGLYRGTSYNLRGLSLEDKASLLAALDADSKAETIHKHPPREQIRENVRKLLR